MSKKILLINPPFFVFQKLEQDYIPLSLLAVGSKMAEDGYDVVLKNMEVGKDTTYEGYSDRQNNFQKYLDGIKNPSNIIWDGLRNTIEQEKPDKIGINVLNVKHKSALTIIDIVEKEYNIPIIVGGNHPTINPNVYPSNVEVFKGEYESNGNRLINLDELPLPNYDILLDNYSPNGYAHILSSRGCPFNCRFCGSSTMWNKKVTFKSNKRIISEMKYIENRFKCNYFTFWDETFTINKSRLKEFCNIYSLSSKWRCDTRADNITDDMVKMMKNSGCGQMSIGIESGVDKILDYVDKGETTQDFINAAEILNKNNIEWKAYCIVGFPEETEEDIYKTIEFIKSLKPFRITLSYFSPYFGTPLYKECIDKKLLDENYDDSLYAHQSPNNYFCPKIPKERYNQIKNIISLEIDEYNKEALKSWK